MIFGLLLMLAEVTDPEILRELTEVTDPEILRELNDPKNPYQKYAPVKEKLGAGPHTLVVSDGSAMTRIDYKTGPLCAKARDSIRRQVASPPSTPSVIYGAPSTEAFCIPR
jgi:hypothetical protein